VRNQRLTREGEMRLDEWRKKVEKGTSGDMVYDILADWAANEDQRARLFVRHIAGHLEKGQYVCCKICGQSIDEINRYRNKP